MNVLELEKDEEIFSYFDVQNLSVDHKLTPEDVEQYKDLIFSPNSLHQVYFKDDCDLESIQLIKNLLTISDYVDDSQIDKIILLKLTNKELNSLLQDTYENPETWSLPYEEENKTFSLTDLPRLRTLKSFIKKIDVEGLSQLEAVMKVYDTIKFLEYDSDNKERQLPEIINNQKADSYGFNKLFSYVLNNLGFKTFVGKLKSNDGNTSYVTLVNIKDEDYKANGIYLFDPSMDTLPQDKYDNKEIRRINYNFFGLNISLINKLSYDDKPDGLLAILSIEDTDYSCEKIEVCKFSKVLKEKERLLNDFNADYKVIHKRLKKTKPIDIDTIIEINKKLYNSKLENYETLLKDNYETRKEELFSKDIEEELDELIEIERNR